jgi:hypothetical protein
VSECKPARKPERASATFATIRAGSNVLRPIRSGDCRKDLDLALSAFHRVDAHVPITALVREWIDETAVADADLDISAVTRRYAQIHVAEVRPERGHGGATPARLVPGTTMPTAANAEQHERVSARE